MKKLKLLAMVTLGFAGLQTASASIVLDPFQVYGGTGLGAVNTILTIQNNPTEAGCISFGGTIGSVLTGGACTGSFADVKTGASQTQTRTLADGGITSASNFALILNAVEPAGGPITLDDVRVAFYSPTGTLLFQSSGLFCATPGGGTPTEGPCFIPVTATGTGNSGYLLTLDAAQQAAATTAGAFSSTSNVIGMSSAFSNSAGGNDTFFIANIQQVAPIPEPATYALIGLGLGAFALIRRRKQYLSH